MARQQVLPYLLDEDLQEGDDVVVEEAPLGRRHFTQDRLALLAVTQFSHYWALDFQTPAK